MSRAYGVLNQKALHVYKQQKVETASPGELVMLLYTEAVRCMRESIMALNDKDYVLSNSKLIKCQDIIDELRGALNVDVAPEVATNLANVYDFAYSRLLTANVKKDASLVEDAMGVILKLRGIWEEVLAQNG